MATEVEDLLAQGGAALRAGDAASARAALSRAFELDPSGDVIEGLARAAYLEQDFAAAVDGWERAYAAHRQAGDHVAAVRASRILAYLYFSIVGDRAVGSGWLARAQTLLGEDPGSPERGWVALNRGMFEPSRAGKEELFRDALAVARESGDSELEFASLAYLGASLVHDDRQDEGMKLLDEALAAVAGNDVEDFCVLEEIFCQLFSACERAHDVSRADQWMRIGEAIAQRRKLPAVAAFCRTHYGGVLTDAGRWQEADDTLTTAVQLWALGKSALRVGALTRLANLRVRQGRFEEAEQLLEGLDHAGDPDVVAPLAAVRLANGEPLLARDMLEGALASIDPDSSAAVPLQALLVDAYLMCGLPNEAAAVAGQLAASAKAHGGHYITAVAALARGRVCAATAQGDPQRCVREALAEFARAHLPIDSAHARLELAGLVAEERAEVAIAEARAALEAFERLNATRYADEAAALLRSLGVRTASAKRTIGTLTKREAEVLDLIGRGLSNPEIAQRLYISRKTVEHHVSNVLSKLALRGRAEAAAYAVRARPGGE
ncbi:MAG TPA: LuxR C-terminal-related transcriptional regulator [Ilumatobacteraceae bacterium]|nr:LuxR C-terminal-related transcriptional regulator [Ilumatobacteraceae bacterium]